MGIHEQGRLWNRYCELRQLGRRCQRAAREPSRSREKACQDGHRRSGLDYQSSRLPKLRRLLRGDDDARAETRSFNLSAFHEKKGQYLAFIYNYTQIHRRAPAELDFERYFRVTPPSVHQMILTLELKRFIERTPGQ